MTGNAAAPARWLYEIDPAFAPDGEIPPEGVVGAWPVDEHGVRVGAFAPNPNYRQSPVARMGTVRDDAFVEALAGLSRDELTIPEFLAEFDALLFETFANDDESLFVVDDERGRRLQVFSSEPHRSALGTSFQTISGSDLRRLARSGIAIEVNPDPGGSAFFEPSFLLATPDSSPDASVAG